MTNDKDGSDKSGKHTGDNNRDGGRNRDDRPRRSFDDKPRGFAKAGNRDGGRDSGRDDRRDGGREGARNFGRSDRPDRPGRPEGGSRDGRGGRGARFSREIDESLPDEGERIAKRLARVGIASRREAETMIAAGRVSVNGKVLTTPAVNVLRSDRITVDNKVLQQAERTRLWLYHKPSGLVTTNRDPEGRRTVFETLPEELPRVLSVGRLDINTEGLLLLTNDGGLSRVLELPSTGWLRRYRVRAHGTVTQAQLDELKNGIAVDGVFYGSVEAVLEREQGSNVWLTVGLREGKNREVKNILGALGLAVSRLIRVSFGPFQLGDLAEGAVREIKGRTLRDQLGEKLIADSGADFDSPVLNEFSNQPVQSDNRSTMAEERSEYEGRPARVKSDWISSTGDAKGGGGGKRFGKGGFGGKPAGRDADRSAPAPFRRERSERGDRREESLARWSTSAPKSNSDRGGRFGKNAEDSKSAPAAERPRGVNVWMAPGAKPYTNKSRDDDKSRHARGGSDGRNENRSRPSRDEARTDDNRRSFTDRPYQGRAEGDQSSSGRGSSGRNFNERSGGDRPFSDRSGGDKPFRGKPRSEHSDRGGFSSDRPHNNRPSDARSSHRPTGGRPAGGRHGGGGRSGGGKR